MIPRSEDLKAATFTGLDFSCVVFTGISYCLPFYDLESPAVSKQIEQSSPLKLTGVILQSEVSGSKESGRM